MLSMLAMDCPPSRCDSSTSTVRGLPPMIFGDGRQTRDFVYVADVARAVCLACKEPKANGKVLNVASGTQTTVLALATVLGQVLQTDIDPTMARAKAGEVRFSQGDATLARDTLGWQPEVSLNEGFIRLLGR